MPHPPTPPPPFSLKGHCLPHGGDAGPWLKSYLLLLCSSDFWVWATGRKDYSVVWIQLPSQLGLAERQRREACLLPTFKMWGVRSPPLLVPGNPSGFVD